MGILLNVVTPNCDSPNRALGFANAHPVTVVATSAAITQRCRRFNFDLLSVRRTLAISCEAVPPSIQPAGAQGGTSARSTGAALSFVSS